MDFEDNDSSDVSSESDSDCTVVSIEVKGEKADQAREVIQFLFEPSSSLYSRIYILVGALIVLCHVSFHVQFSNVFP